ncbi:isopeptide-forming domain-containing fimbrial protein [Bacillus aquiflavi]|uniref:Isopeptide-forming domain-containing fimbrial protein n=1 Tax=Bacillus aquiflavi TaxID=2672567 RepID=A0A6B3W1V2_9BACI|nr:isopeptide-forming domain-containing fimbrial protein [Bacillus aquiflavi]MBA4538137.1 isopeptide-forming domain-containing fimbrial protein [Bacillus aquiflavi]NEY82457.1 isopeptide-forming domain-containing fimbrial protein [Bacillus aquiflavi]
MLKKAGIVAFIFMLISQTIFAGAGIQKEVKAAADSGQSIFTNVSLKSEDGKEIDANKNPNHYVNVEQPLNVKLDWALAGENVKAGDVVLPAELKVTKQQEGTLNTENWSAGTYKVSTDGTVTVTLNELSEAKGSFEIETVLNNIAMEENRVIPLTFVVDGENKIIHVPLQNNSSAEAEAVTEKVNDTPKEEAAKTDTVEEKEPTQENKNNDESVKEETNESTPQAKVDHTLPPKKETVTMAALTEEKENQAVAAAAFTINDVDTYAVSSDGTTLYQLDGNNPGAATPKASISITGITVNGLNGLAISENEDVFYAANGSNLYSINADGTAKFVKALSAGNGISNAVINHSKYYYIFLEDGEWKLGSYDLITGANVTSVIANSSNVNLGGGDIVVDAEGYIWYAAAQNIVQIDPQSSTLIRSVTITNSDGQPIEPYVRGLSFLPNGQMLLSSGNTNITLFLLDPETLSTTYIGAVEVKLSVDLASRPKPSFNPNPPVLKSEKTANLKEKAAGNTDADNPEVGDTILYTIKTQNTIEDSLIENLVISDTLPEGLEYVSGSLKVDGESATDAEGDDKGHYQNGTVVGQFGEITDTEWHTVTFEATIKAGQAGQDIKNIATVGGDNVEDPDKPEEVVKVYPRDPVLESEKSSKNLDEGKDQYEVGDTIVYTIKTRNKVSDSLVENLSITDQLPAGLEYVDNSLKVSHNGTGEFSNGSVTAKFGDVTDTAWRTVTFQAKIKSGQSGETIKNIATVSGSNVEDPDKPSEDVKVYPKDPLLKSEKSANIKEKANGNKDTDNPEVGDTIVYTIRAQNTVSDSLIENLVISDTLPEGLEYVPGSLKVDGELATDAEGDDKGHYQNGTVVGQFGDMTDTEWHTVTFEATIKAGQAGQDIKNIATVSASNVEDPDKPSEEVKVYPRNPVLESEKSAENLDEGKDQYEVGDTIVYTIKTRNKVSDSVVENLSITDKLPAGIEYVSGSLKIDGQAVTDAEDNDNGYYADGTIIGQFGDLTDTEWHTVEFQAKISADQSDKAIENIAVVAGSNIDKQDHPKEIIKVEPTDSKNPAVGLTDPKDPSQRDQLIDKLPQTGEETLLYMMMIGFLFLTIGGLLLLRKKSNI